MQLILWVEQKKYTFAVWRKATLGYDSSSLGNTETVFFP